MTRASASTTPRQATGSCSWQFHNKVPASVKWAPKQMLVASACDSLVLWIPDLQKMLAT